MKGFVTEGELAIPGGTCDYISFGKGSKPLVMIQGLNTRGIRGAGLGLACMYWRFVRDYRVWFFDRKTPLAPGITIGDLAVDYAAAMDAVGIRSAHVLGVSQGGMIAQEIAINRPDLVEKMVLSVTACENNETITAAIESWVSLTEAGNWEGLVEDMTARLYSPAKARQYRPLLPLLAALQKPRDPQRFITLAKSCLTCDTASRLDQIKCPVMVIGGGVDLVVGKDTARLLAEKLRCPLHLYEDLGHSVYEEGKDFNKTVYNFFKA